MAKKDIFILAKKAKRILELDKDLRRKYFNKKPHLFSVYKDDLIAQIYAQLKIDPSTQVSQQASVKIDGAVDNYIKTLKDIFKFSTPKNFSYTITDFPKKQGFQVLVVSNDGSDVYNKIYRIRTDRGAGPLKKLIETIRETFNTSQDILDKIKTLTDIGHEQNSSIAEKTIEVALARFGNKPPNNLTQQEIDALTPIYNIMVSSGNTVSGGRISKDFVVKVSEEASLLNQEKGRTTEAQLITDARKAINNFINSVDWYNQEGSNSVLDSITIEIISAARKSGAKTKSKVRKMTSGPSSAKETIKGSHSKPTKDSVELPKERIVKERKRSQTRNWLQLLPMINSRLTDTVAKNMGSPRLNFRTGRLAQSAKVVGVEQTREGFPSFVFDYERDPYDVFDRTLGRSPWNTPQRDPRALVDQSVREIVREMAIGRFFTRRA